MSIRIYLQDFAIPTTRLVNARARVQRGGSNNVDFHGLNLNIDSDGRLFYQLRETVTHPDNAIPEVLRDYIRLISWWTRIPSVPRRMLGVYRSSDSTIAPEGGTAEAQLDVDQNEPNWLKLAIYGSDLRLMLHLYAHIRAGTALPYQSWEAEQASSEVDQCLPHNKAQPPQLAFGK